MQLCSSVQLREAAVSSSSIIKPRRGNPPLPHTSTFVLLRVSPGRVEGALRCHTNIHLHFMFFGTAARSRCEFFEYHPAGSREPSSASHIYLRFMFPNFRTSLPSRVVNHRCDDSPLVFSAQRCNAPVPVTTGQQDKGTRDALL